MQCSAAASSGSWDAFGYPSPRSHLPTAWGLTFIVVASAACVIPAAQRRSFNPFVVITSDVATLGCERIITLLLVVVNPFLLQSATLRCIILLGGGLCFLQIFAPRGKKAV